MSNKSTYYFIGVIFFIVKHMFIIKFKAFHTKHYRQLSLCVIILFKMNEHLVDVS